VLSGSRRTYRKKEFQPQLKSISAIYSRTIPLVLLTTCQPFAVIFILPYDCGVLVYTLDVRVSSASVRNSPTVSSALAHTSQGASLWLTHWFTLRRNSSVDSYFRQTKRLSHLSVCFRPSVLCCIIRSVINSFFSFSSYLTKTKIDAQLFLRSQHVRDRERGMTYSCIEVVNFRKQYSNHFNTNLVRIKFVAYKLQVPLLMFFLTVHHSIDLFHLPTLMHNYFIH